MIANLSVLLAAAAVKLLDSGWPDIVVGASIAALFLKTALTVLRESFEELHKLKSGAPA
jgi:Co/Zn/Cd efflux system component